jgi:hypothetical protein
VFLTGTETFFESIISNSFSLVSGSKYENIVSMPIFVSPRHWSHLHVGSQFEHRPDLSKARIGKDLQEVRAISLTCVCRQPTKCLNVASIEKYIWFSLFVFTSGFLPPIVIICLLYFICVACFPLGQTFCRISTVGLTPCGSWLRASSARFTRGRCLSIRHHPHHHHRPRRPPMPPAVSCTCVSIAPR